MSQPASPDGLQEERTLLAWRRSSLSLFVAALVICRLAMEDSAPLIVVVSIAAAVVALGVALTSLRGGRWSAQSTTEPRFERLLRDGVVPAVLAGIVGSLCLVELALSVGLHT